MEKFWFRVGKNLFAAKGSKLHCLTVTLLIKTLTAAWKDIEMDTTMRYDAWKHAPAGKSLTTISSSLRPHECNVFILTEAKL